MEGISKFLQLILQSIPVILVAIIVLICLIVAAIFKIKNATQQTVKEIRIMQENQVKIYNKLCDIYEKKEEIEDQKTSFENEYN